jgi:Rrf2 family protein
MQLSRSARYALCAALDMTLAGDEPVSVAQVSRRHLIPEAALAKVFQQLVRSGIARGTRGVGGGYRLARPAARLSVLDVMRAFAAPGGAAQGPDCGGGDQENRLRALFREVDELVRCTFESVTLATLARGPRLKSAAALGTRRRPARPQG